jgi:hypothetical protein
LNESNNLSTKYFLSKTGMFIISEYEKLPCFTKKKISSKTICL